MRILKSEDPNWGDIPATNGALADSIPPTPTAPSATQSDLSQNGSTLAVAQANVLPPLPVYTPVTYRDNGLISRPWVSWFNAVSRRIGGSSSPSLGDDISSAFVSDSPSNNGRNDDLTDFGDSSKPWALNEISKRFKSYGITPSTVTKESTGFTEPQDVIVSYDSTTRKVTLTGTVVAYHRGTIVTALVSGWVSAAHDATVGSWFLFYDGSNFVWQMTTAWTFDQLQIAFVSYGASNKFAIRETHGLMQWQSHKELHETIGTYYNSGGDIAGVTIGSTTAAIRRPSVSETTVSDEDLTSVVTALADDGPYTTLYLTGTGTSTLTTGYAEIVPVTAANPDWNQFVTPNWVQTPMANNSYMSIWLVAVPVTADAGSQLFRYLWVQGQSNGTLTQEQGRTFNSLNLGQLSALSPEFCLIGKIIIQFTAANWRITSVEKITGTRISSTSSPSGNFLSTVSVTAPITGDGTVGSPLAMAAATALVPGHLTSADWSTFNAKAPLTVGTYTAGATTPSVAGVSFMSINNVGATSITNFTGAVSGQVITLHFPNANTTITRANSYLAGSANANPPANSILTLVYLSPYWFEVSRSFTNG